MEKKAVHYDGGVLLAPSGHPRYAWCVRWPGAGGKRLARWFSTKTEGSKWAKEKSDEAGKLGSDFGSVTEDERAALAVWRKLVEQCDPPPPPLVDVLGGYADRFRAARSGSTVAAAVEAFLEEKGKQGLGQFHLKSLKSRLNKFKQAFGSRIMAALTTPELSDWLLTLHGKATPSGKRTRMATKESRAKGAPGKAGLLSAQTRKNHRVAVHAFFEWGRVRGMVGQNPVVDAPAPKAPQRLPGILKPPAVKLFFAALRDHAPELVAFWAVRFFAGVREQEAIRMTWNMMDLDGGEIHLPATVTKNAKPRSVKILPVLHAFLKPLALKAGPMAPQTEMTRRYALGKALDALPEGFRLPPNGARHTFATMHLLEFRHAGETSLQLGHRGSPELLHQHYAGVATETEAAAFWAIRPDTLPTPENVIQMRTAAAEPDDAPAEAKGRGAKAGTSRREKKVG